MKWKNETLMSALSVLIALIALGVSIQSCRIAERSVAIDEDEFASARSAVWTLEIAADSSLRLASVSSDIELQRAFVYFPPGFGIAALPVRAPSYTISSSEKAIEIGISQIQNSEVKRMILGPIAAVPVGIEAWYIAQGELYRDTSLYFLEFRPRVLNDPSDVDVIGLSFARRLDLDDNIRNVLRDEWTAYSAL